MSLQNLVSGLFRFVGFGGMIYGLYIIIEWYVYWLSYYFVGNIKFSLMLGLFTFFLSPIAGIADLFWHSFMPSTIDMWIRFLGFFIGGRIVFTLGHKFRRKE